VHEVGLTSLTLRALEEDIASGAITKKDAERCKNMLALGLVSFMFSHPTKATEEWLAQKFASKPALAEANIKALRAGVNYGDTTEAFTFTYEVGKAELPAGRYRTISGNQATAYGLVAASVSARACRSSSAPTPSLPRPTSSTSSRSSSTSA
jgi:2-oxoglutarate/2-oxoacid ferredoxin oxidoreductase subunit alpha